MLIRQLARALCLPVEVRGAPIVREPDGLALSSRNQYLDDGQRVAGLALSRALAAGAAAASAGAGAATVEGAAAAVLDSEAGVEPDYVALTDPDLGPAPAVGPARLLVAGRVGTTRLLDNAALDLVDRTGG